MKGCFGEGGEVLERVVVITVYTINAECWSKETASHCVAVEDKED